MFFNSFSSVESAVSPAATAILVSKVGAEQNVAFTTTGVERASMHRLKATQATKLLCSVGDWANNETVCPVSQAALVQAAHGYKFFVQRYLENSTTFLVLRASDDVTVELQTLIAYPDRRGNGSTTMRRLTTLADELGVTLWLEAHPFGHNREHISVEKLKGIYSGFGFTAVRSINFQWKSGFHRWDRTKFRNPMIRLPRRA